MTPAVRSSKLRIMLRSSVLRILYYVLQDILVYPLFERNEIEGCIPQGVCAYLYLER